MEAHALSRREVCEREHWESLSGINQRGGKKKGAAADRDSPCVSKSLKKRKITQLKRERKRKRKKSGKPPSDAQVMIEDKSKEG